jgi:6-phosphogluconate dehydrogenase
MSERIGFVGLGIIGLAMARNLANAGFELTAFNRTSTNAEEFAEGNRAADPTYGITGTARGDQGPNYGERHRYDGEAGY